MAHGKFTLPDTEYGTETDKNDLEWNCVKRCSYCIETYRHRFPLSFVPTLSVSVSVSVLDSVNAPKQGFFPK